MSNWTTIPTINDMTTTEKTRLDNKRFKSMMDKVITYDGTPEEIDKKIKKHQEELYLAQKSENAKLLDAFANKKLKSKAAIKRALGLAKKNNDAGKNTDKAAKPQVNPAVEG